MSQVTSKGVESPYTYKWSSWKTPKRYCVHQMNIRAGEILKSHEGHYYRVLEASSLSVSLMRVNGQTIFACRPEYVALNFSLPTSVDAA